jgi:hypothetical protein
MNMADYEHRDVTLSWQDVRDISSHLEFQPWKDDLQHVKYPGRGMGLIDEWNLSC